MVQLMSFGVALITLIGLLVDLTGAQPRSRFGADHQLLPRDQTQNGLGGGGSNAASSKAVIDSFGSLTSEVNRVRHSLGDGKRMSSKLLAAQKIQALAPNLQTSLNLYNSCASCGRSSGLIPVLSSLFQQLDSIMQDSHTTFGKDWSQVWTTVINQVGDSMKQFITSLGRSGIQLSEVLPSNFGAILGQIMFGSTGSTSHS